MIVFQCNKKFSHVTFVQKLIVSLKTCNHQVLFFFFSCCILTTNTSECFSCLVKKLSHFPPEDSRQTLIQKVRPQNIFRFHNYCKLSILWIWTNMILYILEICQLVYARCIPLSFSPTFSMPISCNG